MANIESVKLPNGSEYNIKDAISDYALQSEMSFTDGTGADADKTTIQLKSGTTKTVLKEHQSISGKADKVTGGTNGNLASLDGNGNLTDAGVALNISTPADGQLMKYNGTSGKWENADAPASAPMPNLLDNPWFTVNQRGWNGTLPADTYGIDRWCGGGSGSATVKTGQMYGSSIVQKNPVIEDLIGKDVTFSAIVNGSIVSGTKTLTDDAFQNIYQDTNVQLAIDTRSGYPRRVVIGTSGSSYVITAVKLELGSQSTLALDTAPDYTTELLKCQRDFWRIASQGGGSSIISLGLTDDATTARAIFQTPVPMRTVPTFSYSGTVAMLKDGNTFYPVTNVTLSNTSTQSFLRLDFTSSSMAVGACVRISITNGYFEFSSER